MDRILSNTASLIEEENRILFMTNLTVLSRPPPPPPKKKKKKNYNKYTVYQKGQQIAMFLMAKIRYLRSLRGDRIPWCRNPIPKFPKLRSLGLKMSCGVPTTLTRHIEFSESMELSPFSVIIIISIQHKNSNSQIILCYDAQVSLTEGSKTNWENKKQQ